MRTGHFNAYLPPEFGQPIVLVEDLAGLPHDMQEVVGPELALEPGGTGQVSSCAGRTVRMVPTGYIVAGRLAVCAACDERLASNPAGTGRPGTAIPIWDSNQFPQAFVCQAGGCGKVFYGSVTVALPGEIRQ